MLLCMQQELLEMQIARVIGTVVATKKDENLSGVRLMVIQPCNSKGEGACSEKKLFDCTSGEL